MDWNGIVGSIASVINTALPLFLLEETDGAYFEAVEKVGPATLFKKGDVLKLGNFFQDPDRNNPPVLVNLVSPEGPEASNLAVQINYGDSFNVQPWLVAFRDGTSSVGVACNATDPQLLNLEGLWTYLTHTALTVGGVLTAVVNPTVTIRLILRLEANNQVVIMTAIGAGAAAFLASRRYTITAQNNSGAPAVVTADLEDLPDEMQPDQEPTYRVALPAGVDFRDGIYQLQLQLHVLLEPDSSASDPAIVFESEKPEHIAALRAVT